MLKNIFSKDNKKGLILIIAGVLLLIIIIVFTIIFFIKGSKKSQLDIYLEDMGREFYENYYYEKIGSNIKERENFLKQFETIGIKVSLDTLSKYNGHANDEIVAKFINKKTKEKCDFTNTKIIFYPKSPYKEKSYEFETIIECDK